METRHTPGPWEVQGLNRGPHAGTIPVALPGWGQTGKQGKLVASVCGKAGEQEANAVLIAAAPELLEVLEEMVIMVNGNRLNDLVVRGAEAAIAKATGEQPAQVTP